MSKLPFNNIISSFIQYTNNKSKHNVLSVQSMFILKLPSRHHSKLEFVILYVELYTLTGHKR